MVSPADVASVERAPLALRDVVFEHARRAPFAPALISARDALTFGELVTSADALCETLRLRGLRNGQHVALVARADADFAVALLATSRIAACLPIHASMAACEARALIAAARVSAIVCIEQVPMHIAKLAWELGVSCLRVSRQHAALAWSVEGLASGGVSTPGVALLMPTSGTSGRSKLVPIRSAALLHGAKTIARAIELTSEDRCLNLCPMFHVSGQFMAVFSSWWVGAAAICVDDATHPSLLAAQRELVPTWLCAVPTMLARLAREQADDARALGLSFIHTGAAALSTRDQADIEAAFGAPVIQSYGMTETLMIACNPRPPRARRPGTVGLPQQDVRIVDATGAPVPASEQGEIVVAGGSVMRGYLEARSDDAFTRGYLRTGDVGRLDEHGYLHITGRSKEMINRGGEKVFPLEIDSVLKQHPEVREATAFGFAHPRLGEDVAACVVLAPHARATEAELRHFVAERVGPHKVPRRIFSVSDLPRTATGKRVRTGLAERFERELCTWDSTRGETLEPTVSLVGMTPDQAREACFEVVHQEVGRLLARAEVDPRASFADVGLDSAGLADLRTGLSAVLGVQISQSVLFEHRSIERLARHLAENAEASPGPLASTGPLERPLSATELNWVRALERTGSGVLFEGVHVRGRFVREALHSALADLVACQPLLQLRIVGSGRKRSFERTKRLPPVCEHRISASDVTMAVEVQLARRDFAEDAPLVEVHVFHLRGRRDELVLGFRAHHGIWDGGNHVLVELLHAYDARLRGSVPSLRPRPTLKSVDALAAQSRSKRGVWGAKAKYIADVLKQDLLPSSDVVGPRFTRTTNFTLPADSVARLKSTAESLGVSWSAWVAGAYVQAVRAHMGGEAAKNISLMSFVDVRSHYKPPIEPGTLGYCVSAILQTLAVRPETSAFELARVCSERFTSALASGLALDLHGMSSLLFKASVEWPWLIRRDGRTTTLTFSLVDTFASMPRSTPSLEIVDVVGGASMHGVGPCLCLMIMPVFDELRCLLLHPEPLIDAALVRRISESLESTLRCPPTCATVGDAATQHRDAFL